MKNRLGILVGMGIEAELARKLRPAVIEVSGATYEGAKKALDRVIASGVDAIISFGFAAGLDPLVKAGTLLVPYLVLRKGQDYIPDPALRTWLGSGKSQIKIGPLYHSDSILTTCAEKQEIFRQTGCIAADMESGLVAETCQHQGIPFAVLRVVCDCANRDLPPLVSLALSQDGKLDFAGMIKSLVQHPGQGGDLVGVGMDMVVAYWHLRRFVSVY